MCAVHAVAVCQAVDLRALVGEYFAQVRGAFDAAAAVLDEGRLDRPLGADVQAAVRLVEAGLPA